MAETIITKTCCVCKIVKPINQYYKASTNRDHRSNECKECKHARGSQYAKTDKRKASLRMYAQSERGKEVVKKSQARYRKTQKSRVRAERWRMKHLEVHAAKHAVSYAIRTGRLSPIKSMKCKFCQKQAQQYHHYAGYAKEHRLDVVPVCQSCHIKIHHTVEAFSPPQKVC